MKGFCTSSRGMRIEGHSEQLPSAAELLKLESKLRTVVARAEQVTVALLSSTECRVLLPEYFFVWERHQLQPRHGQTPLNAMHIPQ